MHNHDSQCTLDQDTCTVCGVYHGDPCPVCLGRGFHVSGCQSVSVNQHAWMLAIVANDEVSTDEELRTHFVVEGGVPREIAKVYVGRRKDYLIGVR